MSEIKDNRTIKEISLDYYQTAVSNILVSLYGLKSENVFKQISDDINPIYWIIGHCTTHLELIFNQQCQDKKQCSDTMLEYFAYGAKKEDIMKEKPASFSEILDLFISIYENSLVYLNNLSEEKYRLYPECNEEPWNESIIEGIRRVALHITGHMGQITIIRRFLGNPVSQGFVAGMSADSRKIIYEKWTNWWKDNKEKFQ